MSAKGAKNTPSKPLNGRQANQPRVNAKPKSNATNKSNIVNGASRSQPPRNNQAPKPQRKQNQQQPLQQTKRTQRQAPVQNKQVAKPKKPLAAGPNYVDQGGKRFKIGPDFDARNHMGWRKLEKVGSTTQFLFIPKMVSRADQCYYRTHYAASDATVETFAVGIFVQDSTMQRNILRDPSKLTSEQKNHYMEELDKAFSAILLRTKNSLDNDAPADIVISA